MNLSDMPYRRRSALVTLVAVFGVGCGSSELSVNGQAMDPEGTAGAGGVGENVAGAPPPVPIVIDDVEVAPPMTVPMAPEACVQQRAEADPVTKPVDLIFVIDNSASMGEEIRQVVRQLNTTLYTVLEQAAVDFNVSVISQASTLDRQGVCVVAPLGSVEDTDQDGFAQRLTFSHRRG